MSVPVKCWIVVSRNDCFCPEKSSGRFHLTERDAVAEKKELDEALDGVVVHEIVGCTLMRDDTFTELCPDWK